AQRVKRMARCCEQHSRRRDNWSPMRPATLVLIVAACGPGTRTDDANPTGTDSAAPSTCTAVGTSNAGCELWAVDLANAVDVYGPPVSGICDSFGPDAKLLAALPVCVLPDGTFAGRCDLGASCAAAPAGATCQVRDACGLDAQHGPY